MKQILNRLMWCSAAVLSFGTINAMNDVQPAAVEVASGSDLTPVPQTDVIQAGSFNTETQTYDMVCTGKCELNQREVELIVTPAKKAPSLVKIGEGNTVVYAKPEPMATVHVPNGHDGWVQVRLTNLQNNSSAENRFSLGVRKQGDENSLIRLYTPNSTAGSINDTGTHIANIPAASNEVWELVPLLTEGGAADENYKAVEENQKVTLNSVTSFDFGSVYRVNINYSLWRMDTSNLNSITHEGSWCITSQPGILDGKSQLLAVDYKGGLASSEDGINWVAARSIYNGTDEAVGGWDIPPVYGNGMWCIVNGNSLGSGSGEIRYKPKNSSHWFARGMTIPGARSIAYGNGIFVILTNNKISEADGRQVAYVSEDTQYWRRVGGFLGNQIVWLSDRWLSFAVGDDNIINLRTSHENYKVGDEEWGWNNDVTPSGLPSGLWRWTRFCLGIDGYVYGQGYTNGNPGVDYVYRSNDEDLSKWTQVVKFDCQSNGHDAIFFQNNRLQVVKLGHTHRGYVK